MVDRLLDSFGVGSIGIQHIGRRIETRARHPHRIIHPGLAVEGESAGNDVEDPVVLRNRDLSACGQCSLKVLRSHGVVAARHRHRGGRGHALDRQASDPDLGHFDWNRGHGLGFLRSDSHRLRNFLETRDHTLAGAVVGCLSTAAHDQSLILHFSDHDRHLRRSDVNPDHGVVLVHDPPPSTIRSVHLRSAQVWVSEPSVTAAHQAFSALDPCGKTWMTISGPPPDGCSCSL